MQVDYISTDDVNSELGIVNGARVSLAKKSSWSDDGTLRSGDRRLIQFLWKNLHFTPLGHPRLYFFLPWSVHEELHFYRYANLGGFVLLPQFQSGVVCGSLIKGSLYGWLTQLHHITPRIRQQPIYNSLHTSYPTCASFISPEETCENLVKLNGVAIEFSEQDIFRLELWKLATVTLLITVPIFVARQIRTSQIGFAYSDFYVEGESFVYNEVSRRYVTDDPTFHSIQTWRVREGSSIKQGSTGIASPSLQNEMSTYQHLLLEDASNKYNCYSELGHIAPEQLRSLLPQSMETQFYMTGTLHRWAQWLSLRLKPDVQDETREIAEMVKDTLKNIHWRWGEVYGL